jgi:hypothetical protein
MRKSGWRSAAMRKGRPPAELPIIASAWDAFLAGHGWTLEDALASPEAQGFARKIRHNRFVPEAALKAWGWTEG